MKKIWEFIGVLLVILLGGIGLLKSFFLTGNIVDGICCIFIVGGFILFFFFFFKIIKLIINKLKLFKMKNFDVKELGLEELNEKETKEINGGLTVVICGSFVIAAVAYIIWGRKK